MFERKLFYENREKYNRTVANIKGLLPEIDALAAEYDALGLGKMQNPAFAKYFKLLKYNINPADQHVKIEIRKEYAVLVDINLAKNQVPKAMRENIALASVGGRNPLTNLEVPGDVQAFVEKFKALYSKYHNLFSWDYSFAEKCAELIQVKDGKSKFSEENQNTLLETYQVYIENETQDEQNNLMEAAQKSINELVRFLEEKGIEKSFEDCIFFHQGRAVINTSALK